MKTGNWTAVEVRGRFLASNFISFKSSWNFQGESLRNLCILPFLCMTNPNPNPSKKKTKLHWIRCSAVLYGNPWLNFREFLFSRELPAWIVSRSVIRTVNICLNYIPFLILFFDLGSCLLLLSSHLMGFLWLVIFHFLSKFVSVLFKIVKKLLIVHILVIPMECLSKDSTQKRVVLSLNWRISHLVTV